MTDTSSSSDGEYQVKRPRKSDQDEIQPKNVRPKRKVNCKKNSADFEPENDGICHIDRLPALVLTKIFEHLDYPNRLRVELVSPRWQKISKEESWRHFSQCKLPKPHSTAHLKTLFNRSGKYIQELIFAPNSPDDKLNQYSVGRLSDWIHLMPKLHTICIVDRQLAHREKSKFEITSPLFYNQLRNIKCLYLEGCLNKSQRANNFDTMRLLVGECTSLHYLGLTKSRYYSAPAGVIDGNRVYNENETHCQIGSNVLRQLRIDDSFQIERILLQKEFPQLIGLSLSFNGVHNFVRLCQNPKIRPIFQNLKQFELGFIREPGKNILEYVEKVIPFLGNVRILSMEYIDGNNIEQFEYLCHKENILDNFPQICQFTKLRFLWFRHYSEANPKETPKIVLETLKELAGKGKLEHLSINMKLPMDLVLHIVQECPFLDYLEYSKVPSNLSELNTKIHELSQTRQSPRPLNFRIPYNHFWKIRIGMKSNENGQNIAHSPWLKLRHQPPRRESAVMREHLKCVFDGAGDVPEFLTLWPREDDGEL